MFHYGTLLVVVQVLTWVVENTTLMSMAKIDAPIVHCPKVMRTRNPYGDYKNKKIDHTKSRYRLCEECFKRIYDSPSIHFCRACVDKSK